MQYYYIVVYTIANSDDDTITCRIGLNLHQMIEWGRKEATIHSERTYKLFRNSITRIGTPCFYKQLPPFTSEVRKNGLLSIYH